MRPYYDEDGIQIFHGDCREFCGAFDVTITDPPYGVNIGNHAAASEKRPQFLSKGQYLSYEDSYENFLEIVVPAIKSFVGRSKRSAVFCAGTMAWDLPRPDAVGGVYLPAPCGRNCWGFSSLVHCLFYGSAPDLNLGSKPIAIWSSDSGEVNGHPTVKPLSWMKWLVSLASRESETIIDPFMGSGTTLRAAKDLGRRAIGIEIEEKYCEIAAKRLAQKVMDFS